MGNIQQAQLYGSPTYTINGVPVTQAQFYAYGSGTPYPGTTTTTAPTVTSTPSTPVPPDQVSTVTGIDPAEVAAATYGKIIPLWVGGQLRLGAHIIYGPTFRDEGGFRVCDFGVSFGMPANNIGTRTLVEIRLDGAKAWHVSGGYSYNPLVFRFYPGDETQAADPLVIAAHPTAPVAHRGQCCIFLEGIRIADFNYKVPFVSALIGDTTDTATPEDGVNLGDALEQIAASPYVNLPSTDFITEGVSERVDAVIVAEKMAFMELINRYARLYLWDIVQTDRLKVIERGTVAPDLSLDLTNILASEGSPPITVQRAQQPDVAKELDYSWIDPDRDYEINTVTIKRPRAPVPVTASSGKDTISLPSVHTVQEATAWATLRKFKDELARETISFTASVYGYELEPGDIVSVDAGFKTYILRVLETLRGANWTNQIKAEPVLRCAFPPGGLPSTNLVEARFVGAGGLRVNAGAVSTLWTPANLSVGPWAWYKIDEISGTDGDEVLSLTDASGNARHSTAVTASKPNLQVAEKNGLNVVSFAGSSVNEAFFIPSMAALTAGYVAAMINCDTPTGFGGPYMETGTGGDSYHPFNDGKVYDSFGSSARKNNLTALVSLGTWHVSELSSKASEWKWLQNAQTSHSTATNTAAFSSTVTIARSSTLNYWHGMIGEIVLLSYVPTDSERKLLQGYLANKWGTQANLPGGHPYQSGPPHIGDTP